MCLLVLVIMKWQIFPLGLHKSMKHIIFCWFGRKMVCGRNETSKAICTLEMNYLKLHPCKRLHAKTFTRRLQNSYTDWMHDHRDLIHNRKFFISYPVNICGEQRLQKTFLPATNWRYSFYFTNMPYRTVPLTLPSL